jgi:hypothetical protein
MKDNEFKKLEISKSKHFVPSAPPLPKISPDV